MSSSELDKHGVEGVAGMDREHAVEMQIVRSLQGALLDNDRETAAELMGQLEDFTNAHFLAEQLLMRLHAYPAYEAHQQEHDRLIGELVDLRQSIESGEQDPATAVEAIEAWLLTHIHTSDEDLASFLKQASMAGSGEPDPTS
ncbi:MAG: hemerythrin family protein [Acidobacteriota bacterium]